VLRGEPSSSKEWRSGFLVSPRRNGKTIRSWFTAGKLKDSLRRCFLAGREAYSGSAT
jgi:hypothetical protein